MSKMRMYYYILGTKPYYKEVSFVEEAKIIVDAIADFVNAKIDEGVFPDHCSTAGLEEYDEEEKEWDTWYDENGLDFDEHFNMENMLETQPEFIEVEPVNDKGGLLANIKEWDEAIDKNGYID